MVTLKDAQALNSMINYCKYYADRDSLLLEQALRLEKVFASQLQQVRRKI